MHRLSLLLMVLVFAGCSPTPKTAKVSGEVTLDGQPLKDGRIQFIPVAGDTGTAGAIITDGKFTADVPVSKMRVEINANKVVGKRKVYEDSPQSPWAEDVRELILPRYNSNSELTLDVKHGSQDKNFELKSK